MNHIQEEHRIRLFSAPMSDRDSFVGLWTSIARQQHFMKLSLPGDQPIADEINQAIRQRDGSISPYSSQVFQTYRIIYQKGRTVIVTNQPTTHLGTFFAVEDTDCPHRYFIAFAFPVGAIMESITGLIVYFNEKGYCYSDRTIICHRVLATYDTQNGIIREKQIHLYHQSLIFTQVYRDTQRLFLYLNYIPYRSEVIEDHASYYTSYIVPHCCATRAESITLFKRYLHVPLSESSFLLDLGSLECVEERDSQTGHPDHLQYIPRYFVIHSYRLPQKADTMTFLEIASLFPEKEYSDGYPLYCIQCHMKTVVGSYTYKSAPSTSTYMCLGNSYCSDCRIRYSNSKKKWLCAEIRLNGMICDGHLLETGCRSSALHSSDQTILLLYDEPTPKFPYRQQIQIQWIPSEEASSCARVSQLTTLLDSSEDT